MHRDAGESGLFTLTLEHKQLHLRRVAVLRREELDFLCEDPSLRRRLLGARGHA
jgi:hypothetical protein